jgi:hypothetical protein
MDIGRARLARDHKATTQARTYRHVGAAAMRRYAPKGMRETRLATRRTRPALRTAWRRAPCTPRAGKTRDGTEACIAAARALLARVTGDARVCWADAARRSGRKEARRFK